LLLSPLREVVILSRRIILPRVRGRHCDVFWAAVGWDMSRRREWARGEESKSRGFCDRSLRSDGGCGFKRP
jgi:hypothetical protein